jgi:hypothetical protein
VFCLPLHHQSWITALNAVCNWNPVSAPLQTVHKIHVDFNSETGFILPSSCLRSSVRIAY